MNVFRQSLPALRRAASAGAGRAGGVRHMSGHGTQVRTMCREDAEE